MGVITVERAVQELGNVGVLTVSSRYGDMQSYTLEWKGFTLQAQGYVSDQTKVGLPGINLFGVYHNLHPALHLYQDYVAIQRMKQAGYVILLDRLSDSRFRVRVQRKEGRRYVYNEHTTSTSGYPILSAHEKWHAYVDRKKREELEAAHAAASPPRLEVLFYQSDWDGVFYHGQTRKAMRPESDGPAISPPIVGVLEGVSGMERKPYILVVVEAETEAAAETIALQAARQYAPFAQVHMKAEV